MKFTPQYLREYYERQGIVESVWTTYRSNRAGTRYFFMQRFRSIFSLMELRKDVLVLDAGGGTGEYSVALAQQGCRVICIDVAKSYLSSAREAAKLDKNEQGINFIQASVEKLPFRDGRFDTVLCTEVLEHVLSPYEALNELKRVSKDNADIIISFPSHVSIDEIPGQVRCKITGQFNEHVSLLKPMEFKKWCRGSGIRILDVKHSCFCFRILSKFFDGFPKLLPYFRPVESYLSQSPFRWLCWCVIYKLRKGTELG